VFSCDRAFSSAITTTASVRSASRKSFK
jgi:hypothetical protein